MKILVDHHIFPTKESASNAVKIATGHVDIMVIPRINETVFVPKSISFESMPHEEFQPMFEAALVKISELWIHAGTDALKREIYAAIDGPARIGDRLK